MQKEYYKVSCPSPMVGNLLRLLRTVLIILPALAVYLGQLYEDYFYFVLAVIFLALFILLSKPAVLHKKTLTLPRFSKRKIQGFLKPIKKGLVSRRFDLDISRLKTVKKIPKLRVRGKAIPRRLMLVLSATLIAFLVVFTYISIYKLNYIGEGGLFTHYYTAHLNFAKNYSVYFLLLFLASTSFAFSNLSRRRKRYKSFKALKKPLAVSSGLAITAILLGLGLSLLSTALVAAAEVNLTTTKAGLNLTTGEDAILEKLKGMDKPPKIVGVDHSVKKTLVTLETGKGKSEFYKNGLIPRFPDWLIFSFGVSNEALIMSGDTLLIAEIDKRGIEKISPTIGRLFLKQKLAPRYIKEEPFARIMSRQEYLRYREDQINEEIGQIDSLTADTQRYLNQVYSNIKTAKNRIAELEKLIPDSEAKRDSYDSYCRSLSYCGIYYCYDYTDFCNSKRDEWNRYIAGLQSELQEWRAYLPQVEQEARSWEGYKADLILVKEYKVAEKETTPNELGLFEPEKTVKVVLESTSSESVADFFATLIHEYLHYSSYVSEEKAENFPLFFEEGLTEYFARKTIEDQLGARTNLGYPIIYAILAEMTKKVSEEELEQIYFTKDKRRLMSLLNSTYGKNFYDESEYYFEAMSYVSSKEALKFANNIMFRIGGEELTEEDIRSTWSEF